MTFRTKTQIKRARLGNFRNQKLLLSSIAGASALAIAKNSKADSGGGGVGHPTIDVMAAKKHYATMQTAESKKFTKSEQASAFAGLLLIAALCFRAASALRHNRLERAKKEAKTDDVF